jgi:hypothetical protein
MSAVHLAGIIWLLDEVLREEDTDAFELRTEGALVECATR